MFSGGGALCICDFQNGGPKNARGGWWVTSSGQPGECAWPREHGHESSGGTHKVGQQSRVATDREGHGPNAFASVSENTPHSRQRQQFRV